MASEGKLQERMEATNMYLDSMMETIVSVKEIVNAEDKAAGTKAVESTKIAADANLKTVAALKRTVNAVRASFKGDDKPIDGVEKLLEDLKITVKNSTKTLEEGHGAVKYVEDIEKIVQAGADKETGEDIEVNKKSLDAEIQTSGTKEKARVVKKTVTENAQTVKSGEKTEVPMEAGDKFLESWDLMSEYIVADWKTETKEKQETFKDLSVRAKEKCPRTKESSASDNEKKGMDNALNAMLFSEQLIEYVLNKLGNDWPCIEGARQLPRYKASIRFTKVIGEAMLAIIDSNIEKVAESYKQLIVRNVHKIDSFRKEICVTATYYFAKGYSHDHFLIYAAQLSGLSAFYFASGNTQIADASAQVLAYILNYYIHKCYFSPTYDWFNLHLEAQNLRKDIQNREIEFLMP